MNVNDHERPTLHLTQIKGKEQYFNGCSSFHGHSRVFNNENNSYLTMSAKRPQVSNLHRGTL